MELANGFGFGDRPPASDLAQSNHCGKPLENLGFEIASLPSSKAFAIVVLEDNRDDMHEFRMRKIEAKTLS